MKNYIDIAGERFRVEANWNAISEFLQMVGRDTFQSLAELSTLRPSDVTAMMAAAINEGERLDGRELHMTAAQMGALCSMSDIAEFLRIYTDQLTPKTSHDEEPKKD